MNRFSSVNYVFYFCCKIFIFCLLLILEFLMRRHYVLLHLYYSVESRGWLNLHWTFCILICIDSKLGIISCIIFIVFHYTYMCNLISCQFSCQNVSLELNWFISLSIIHVIYVIIHFYPVIKHPVFIKDLFSSKLSSNYTSSRKFSLIILTWLITLFM